MFPDRIAVHRQGAISLCRYGWRRAPRFGYLEYPEFVDRLWVSARFAVWLTEDPVGRGRTLIPSGHTQSRR